LATLDGEQVTIADHVVAGPVTGTIRLGVDGLRAHASWTTSTGQVHQLGELSLAAMGAVASGGFVGTTYGLHCTGSGVVSAHGLGLGDLMGVTVGRRDAGAELLRVGRGQA